MKKVTIFTLMLMLFASVGFSQTKANVLETFDALSEGSYGNYDHNGFHINNGLCSSTNARSGNAVRLNKSAGAYLEYQGTDGNGKDGGISDISFWYRNWDGNPAVVCDIKVNIDGAGWNTIGTQINTTSTTYTEWTYSLSDASDNILVKVEYVSGERIHIDDFSITDFGAGPSVPKPVLTPGTGNYTTTQNVTMAVEADDKIGYDIYYTLDGTAPTDASTLYTVGVDISETTTLKAITYLGMDASNVTTGIYTFPVLPTEVATIAELRSMLTSGKDAPIVYTLTGEAFLTYQQDYKNMKYVQDATGGIEIFDESGIITSTYALKDGIKDLTGTLSVNSGMIRLTPTADPGAAFSNNNTIVPIELSVTEFNAALAVNESMLVTVMAAHFDGADVGNNFATGTNYDISNNDVDLAIFRTQFYDASYIGMPIPAENQDITGIMLQYNGTPQIAAREIADITASPIPPVPVSSKGIMIAGLLIGLVVVIRKGRLF